MIWLQKLLNATWILIRPPLINLFCVYDFLQYKESKITIELCWSNISEKNLYKDYVINEKKN
jgi:hypothetical protein